MFLNVGHVFLAKVHIAILVNRSNIRKRLTMPRNGSGSYALPNGPFIPSTVISSTVMNQNLSDLGTALTQSLANDGQTTPVANLPMATFRHTNVGNAVARNEYAAAGQVQDGSLQWLTSVAGTNTITASIAPSPGAYVAGQSFRFVAAGGNTGATTLNINGLGAKAITKSGTVALSGGEIISGAAISVIYDGTQFQMIAVPHGQIIDMQVFTASGTWTKPAGCSSILIEVIGGGGGGGGAAATASNISIGGGGGAGGYSRKYVTTGIGATETVTVGAGGAGNSGAAGSNGGTSSFGAHCSGAGGFGAGFVGPTTGVTFVAGGDGGTGSSGNYNGKGGMGAAGLADTASISLLGGSGGASYLSAGGYFAGPNTAGAAASANSGSGGGGAANSGGQAARAGGAGGSGIVIVFSYT